MSIHIEVMAELQRRSIEKAARELDTKFHDRRVEVGADVKAAEIKAAAAKIQKEFDDIRAQVKVDVDPNAAKRIRDIGKAGKSTNTVLQELGTTAFKTGRGLATLAAGPAVLGLIEFTRVATAATQALWLLPAAATAGAAGIGTLAIATHGFGDAIKDMGDPKKFAENLALLSPNAQQAALAIKSLVDGPLGELKKATQDNFFAGISDQLQNLSRIYVPEVRKMTTGIADAFNQAMQGVGNLLATPAVQGQLSTTMANITTAFQNAAPAAQSLAQAFIDIAEVGSGFLPDFGKGIADAAAQFAAFIREARESGKLQEWIQQGIDAVKNLATAVSELTQIFFRVFGPGATEDINNMNSGVSSLDQTLQSYNADLTKTSDIIGLLSVDTETWSRKWNEEMLAMQGPLGVLRDAILDIPEAMEFLVEKVVNGLIDALNFMGKNAHDFMSRILPGDQPPLEPIPHVNLPSSGDWSGYRDTGAPPRARRNRAGQPIGPTPSTGPAPPGGSIFDGPPVPPDGGKPSDKERRDAIIAGLDPALWQVDPFGGMAGMQMGPNADPQDVLEQQRNVISEAHDLEEATKNRLALERDNTATAQDIDEAKWKEVEEGWQLQEAQVKLAEKMAGTAKDVKAGSDELSAALDPDLGLGKGLAGLADNLVRFLGHLALAPIMAKGQQAINQQEAATGIKGGYGLLGIMGAQNLSQGLSPLLGRPMPGDTAGTAPSMLGAMPSAGTYSSATASAGALPTTTNGTTAPMSAGTPKPGESARAFAHRVMMPHWQNQGFTVGDHAADRYGEHQAGALDIMVNDLAEGNRVLQEVLADPNVYGAIFNNQTYGYGHGATPRSYSAGNTGNPTQDHMDHVHAWYKPGGAGNIQPGSTPTVGSATLGTPLPTNPTTNGGWWPGGSSGGGAAPLPISGGGGQSPVLSTYGGPGIGGALGANPTVPGGTGVGTRLGAAVEPYSNPGGGGAGIAQGGPIDTAIQGAAAAADLFAPGSGQAIQMGMKLANRAIQYGGQMAGIGVSGLLETFLPTGGSELANNNWLTRIAGGFAGAAPQIPNLAGKGSEQGPLTPQQVAAVQGDKNLAGFENKPGVVVNYQNNGATEDRAGADLAFHLGQVNSPGSVMGGR